MSQRSDQTARLRGVIEEFLDTLASTLSDTHEIERVLAGDETPGMGNLNDNLPESRTEETLIWPLIEAAGLNREPGRPAKQRTAGDSTQREAPDFRLIQDEGEFVVIGENKSLNNIDNAEQELVNDYLANKAWPDYGIATDGFEWVVYRAEHGGDFLEFDNVKRVDIRPAINAVARDLGHIGSGSISEVDVEEVLNEFVSVFAPDALQTLLTQTAPKEFRDTRNANVEAFYELYIELLFGEGDEYDYDTSLSDDIIPPDGASGKEQDLFVVTLMNRLIFVKFLETRGVLPDGFLRGLVSNYREKRDSIPGTFYETHIKTLFYDLFNTPEDERRPDLRTGRYSDVPYLNGGLFRENIRNEAQYNLLDRTLPRVVDDLIEGHRLGMDGGGFDPAILGSVFEKTINYIGGEEGRQKKIGAYYTPDDVTRHISENTVDPKVKEIITETFVEQSPEEHRELVRSQIQDANLSEILRHIEDGTAMYGSNPEALEATLDRLTNLTILDPACGSGHFLTTAMEELHQVQLSVLRGLNGGDDPPRRERYEAKKELALNAIYGVDVDEMAVEIAKLRVWLKIVEGNSWDEAFGRLPNIDVNIAAGNSLVGFPVVGDVQTQVGAVDERLSKLAEMRRAYKFENEGSLQEIRALERKISRDRDDKYLRNLTETAETEVCDAERFDRLVESIPDGEFYPTIQSVKVQRWDDGGDSVALTDADKDLLGDAGFEWQEWRSTNKSAKLDIEEQVNERRNRSRGELNVHKAIVEDLRRVLNAGFVFPEVERQPTHYDLNNITGQTLHWDIEFPELLDLEGANGLSPDVSFDIVVGNPPYGDILNESETVLTKPYLTGSINDVSAPFVERQLQLTADGGYFGNITTLRLIYQSSLEEFHNLLRESLEPARVACFGFRPSRVFENPHVRVAIITGAKVDRDAEDILTSDLLLFNEDNREEVMKSIEYGQTEGLVLRDKINGDEGSPILPKVGGDTKREILCQLRDQSDEVLGDRFERDEPTGEAYKLFKRRGVLYWINPMLEKLYDGSEVVPVWFDTQLERDTAFLVMNSSLYFVYWQTYSNQHHHNWSHMKPFPFPDDEAMEARDDEIEELASTLWDRMKDAFSKSRESRGDFFMSTLRPIIDDVDALVGELYDLTDEQVAYTQNYLTDLGEGSGRAGTGNQDITYEPLVANDD